MYSKNPFVLLYNSTNRIVVNIGISLFLARVRMLVACPSENLPKTDQQSLVYLFFHRPVSCNESNTRNIQSIADVASRPYYEDLLFFHNNYTLTYTSIYLY